MKHNLPILFITLSFGTCAQTEAPQAVVEGSLPHPVSSRSVVPEESGAASQFEMGTKLYVSTTMADERIAPSDSAPVMSQLYKEQIVTVYDISGDWVRVNEKRFSPRWIKASSLSKDLD